MIDQVFFAVARQIDWDRVAEALVERPPTTTSPCPRPPGGWLWRTWPRTTTSTRVSCTAASDAGSSSALSPTPACPRELRRALLRLARRTLGSGDVHRGEARVVLDWLTGERVGLGELRAAMISARIGRHNARAMLTSIGRLLLRAGGHGLVLHLDLARLAEARRPPIPSAPASTTARRRCWTRTSCCASSSTRRTTWSACWSSPCAAGAGQRREARAACPTPPCSSGRRRGAGSAPRQPVRLAGPARGPARGRAMTPDTGGPDRLARRRAVEALRSGVPNADAVTALGSGQSDIEDRFTGLLSRRSRGAPARARLDAGRRRVRGGKEPPADPSGPLGRAAASSSPPWSSARRPRSMTPRRSSGPRWTPHVVRTVPAT